MTAGQWPFPGDSPAVRARKIALAYRRLAQEACEQLAAAGAVDAAGQTIVDPVAVLDRRCQVWGERWVAETPVRNYHDDDMVPAGAAGDLIGISADAISAARRRGRITGRWDRVLRGYRYRVGDVHRLSSALRTRGLASRDHDS